MVDPIRLIAPLIVAPLVNWPMKLASALELGVVAEAFATPLFVLCVILAVEALARRLETRWLNLGVPAHVRAAPSSAAAVAVRYGRRFRPNLS